MLLLLFKLYLLCSRLHTLTEATSKPTARMTFTLRETAMKRFPLLGHHAPAGIVLEKEPSTVISAEQKRLKSFNFQNPHEDCSFNIYLSRRWKLTSCSCVEPIGRGTACCDMDVSEKTPRCMSSAKIQNIKKSIRGFIIKEGEPAALVESEDSNLYVTYSGSRGDVGIHRFGWNRVGPTMHDRSSTMWVWCPADGETTPLQGKVFGFYREKNKDQAWT
ncbi:hypothetical protein KUCAC02_006212, partial [Chaenocephalus aceratus]